MNVNRRRVLMCGLDSSKERLYHGVRMKFGLPAPSTVFTFSGTSVTVKRIILEFHHKGRLLFSHVVA